MKTIHIKEKRVLELERQAIQMMQRGHNRSAERLLMEMLRRNSESLPAHFQLTRVYRRTAQYDLALQHGRRTLQLSPRERNAALNLGLVYEFIGNDRQATFYYRKELSRNADSGETLYNIGRLYFNKKRWRQASVYLARCVDIGYKYNYEDTVDKLARCYYNLRDTVSYINLHARYLERFPQAKWAAANLGRALLYSGDYKGAVRWLSLASRGKNRRNVLGDLKQAKEMISRSRKYRRR